MRLTSVHMHNRWSLMQVMQVVKSLTQGANSITVCATIHSPSAYTFRLFDRLLILLRGRLAYFGTVGTILATLPGLIGVGPGCQHVAATHSTLLCSHNSSVRDLRGWVSIFAMLTCTASTAQAPGAAFPEY